jgi:hypothetical protein
MTRARAPARRSGCVSSSPGLPCKIVVDFATLGLDIVASRGLLTPA